MAATLAFRCVFAAFAIAAIRIVEGKSFDLPVYHSFDRVQPCGPRVTLLAAVGLGLRVRYILHFHALRYGQHSSAYLKHIFF